MLQKTIACARPFYTLALLCCLVISGCEPSVKLEPLEHNAIILAFGDSLTSGHGADKAQAYPARLQTLISRTVINAGVPGEISLGGLQRLPTLLRQHQPDLVIICHGGNDILRRLDLQQTRTNIQQMIELSRAHGAQVVLVGVPEYGIFLSSAQFYSELAKANRLPIENSVLSDVLQKAAHKSDQIHPNADGYAIIAERLAALLQKSDAI
ncbi:MAG: arylesterase [Gammaproteobacteria bacterium]